MEHSHTQSQQEIAPLDVLILAAGLGTRMRSGKAKVLHELDGRALIEHVVRTALELKPRKIYVVVGHQAREVETAVRRVIDESLVQFVLQSQQRGTGDAVMAASDSLSTPGSIVLVVSGDVPLVKAQTLSTFLAHHQTTGAAASLLSTELANPTGYGRVIRDDQNCFVQIVEERDTNQVQKAVKEINAGFYCFDSGKLFSALKRVEPQNAQGEYYLTDVPGILIGDGEKVSVYLHGDSRELSGINTRAELAEFENLLRRQTVRRLMTEAGVTFIDPSRVYINSEASLGRDCTIHPDVTIEAGTTIGENCTIRSGSRIRNSTIGDNVTIQDHCVITDSEIGSHCSVGPFAHLRMNAKVEEKAAVGNFVEMKKSTLGKGSKSMHLTYLGDATIGEHTNIGAGTITCNYDGRQKHQTIIEDNVKIGSDTMLVAPVTVGSGSITGAGSVVTKDVPPDSLVAGVPATVRKKLK